MRTVLLDPELGASVDVGAAEDGGKALAPTSSFCVIVVLAAVMSVVGAACGGGNWAGAWIRTEVLLIEGFRAEGDEGSDAITIGCELAELDAFAEVGGGGGGPAMTIQLVG
jgi:hypothetical protein